MPPLTRRSLPVPVNPIGEILGLRAIESQDPTLQPALNHLREQGEFPWDMGWSREVRLGVPTHLPKDQLSMGWRHRGSDVININRNDPFYQAAQTQPDIVPILGSNIFHENTHVGGAGETEALRRQAQFLSLSKSERARRFGQIIDQVARGTQ